ncbi:MAG: YciI family protein [Candidatus Acidiferrales bacterium]
MLLLNINAADARGGARDEQATFLLEVDPAASELCPGYAADERAVMQQHVQYVGEAFNQGSVLIYGPVLATAGAYGMAVLEMTDAAEVQKFMAEDPSITSGLNTFEFYPMQVGQARGKS